jgi:hypothetical protein
MAVVFWLKEKEKKIPNRKRKKKKRGRKRLVAEKIGSFAY